MKVSERISKIRNLLTGPSVNRTIEGLRTTVKTELIQFEAEIVEALQEAREQGHDIGFRAGYMEGLRMCNLPNKG